MEGPRQNDVSLEAERAQNAFKRSADALPDRQPVEPLRGDAGKGSFEKATGILKDPAEKQPFQKATEILKAAAEEADKDLAARISEAVRNGDMEVAAELMARKADQEAKKE